MNAMAQSVLALYTLDDNPDATDIPNVLRQCLRLTAVFPLLAAYCYRACVYRHHNRSLVLHTPSTELPTAANFLHASGWNSRAGNTSGNSAPRAIVSSLPADKGAYATRNRRRDPMSSEP